MDRVRVCKRCGKAIEGYHPQANYCDQCRAELHLENWDRVREERKRIKSENQERARQEKELREKKKRNIISIAEIDKLAKAEGLSYGKYVSKYGV